MHTTTMLTTTDVATRLNLDDRTVQVWASTGYLPAFKLGSVWRFDAAEIEAFLQQNRRQPWRHSISVPHRTFGGSGSVTPVSKYEDRQVRRTGGRPKKSSPR